MMTKEEVQLAMLTGGAKTYGETTMNDLNGDFIAYRDQRGMVHCMAYTEIPRFVPGSDMKFKGGRGEAVRTIKNVMLDEVEADRQKLHDAMKLELGYKHSKDPLAESLLEANSREFDRRVEKMIDAGLKQFAGEEAAIDQAFKKGDWLERSDAPAALPEEKEKAVVEWAKQALQTREGVKFLLEERDGDALLKLIEQKVGIAGEPARRMLEMEAVKAAGGIPGQPMSQLTSAGLRRCIEKDMAEETADKIRLQNDMARSAILETADENSRRLKAGLEAQLDAGRKAAEEKIWRVKERNASHIGTPLETEEDCRKDAAQKEEQLLEIGKAAEAENQKMKERQLSAVDRKTSERLVSAAGRNAPNEKAFNACFPGGMGKAAQNASENAEHAEQSALRAGR